MACACGDQIDHPLAVNIKLFEKNMSGASKHRSTNLRKYFKRLLNSMPL